MRFFPTRVRIFLLSLFLSFVFWVMITLNREYNVRLDFAVSFDYPKEGVVVVAPLPERVALNVSGVGWNLFKNAPFMAAEPLKIALPNPTAVKIFDKSSLFSLFSEQLGDIRLNYVVTDSLKVDIQRQIIRPISVLVNRSSIALEEGYRITSPIQVLPETFYVTGPEEFVQKLPMDYVLDLGSAEALKDDFEENLSVNISTNKLVRVDAPTIKVRFSVEKFERKSVAVQVGMLNFRSSRSYRPFLEEGVVQVSYTIKLSDEAEVSADNFLVVADYKNLDPKTRTVPLEILDYPAEYVSEMQIIPSELNVRYERKN